MCLFPKIIKNKKYTANKKNKGKIPKPMDERVLHVPVACGKCMECKHKKARDWQVRLSEEIKTNKNGKFVTLSFSNEAINELKEAIENNEKKFNKLNIQSENNGLSGYNLDNEIATIATRRFLERWRKKYKKSIRHWLVSELGSTNTERIHLHGILFTDEIEDIEKIWKYGNVYIGDYVNEKTINYMVKYVHKTDKKHPNYNSKILTSPGIGKNYTTTSNANKNKFKPKETIETYTNRTGQKVALPIYYRNKIYTEEEKEKLWIEKLDKQIRWVDGQKVDVSKDLKCYYRLLKEAQRKNKELGYGNDEVNWEKKYYENQIRILKQAEYMNKHE